MAQYNITVSNSLNRKTVIVDGDMTVYELFEHAGIPVGNGKVSVGGRFVTDLDTTLDDLGLNPNIQIQAMSTVKSENAATAKVTGSVVVVTSAHKLEDIQKIEKYAPEALKLLDENGDPSFIVTTETDSCGNLSTWSAAFSDDTTADGLATITLPYEGKDPAKYVEEAYGIGLYKLNKVEHAITEALSEVGGLLDEIRGAISVE